jgi:voltage-gated potassium channel
LKKLRIALLLLAITIGTGTLGYHIVEKMPVFDAFYMTIITISTVGFEEVKDLSMPGRIITMFVIATGITIAGYTLGSILKMLVEGDIHKSLGRRSVEKK